MEIIHVFAEEIRIILISNIFGDLYDGQIRGFDKHCGVFQTLIIDVLRNGHACILLKRTANIGRVIFERLKDCFGGQK